MAETGKKYPSSAITGKYVIDQIKSMVQAGAMGVYLERHEIEPILGERPETPEQQMITKKRAEEIIIEIAEGAGQDYILFEDKDEVQWAWLVEKFGPDVNIANVEARTTHIVILEEIRRGVNYFGNFPYIRSLMRNR